MNHPDSEPEPARDDSEPTLGLGFTLAVMFGPVGFFGIYLLAVSFTGARTWVGALMLSVLAAASYVGVAMVGTRWFDKHRRG